MNDNDYQIIISPQTQSHYPYICRKCSNYDQNYDSVNGEVKEYCDITGKEIDSDTVCVVVESKKNKLTEEFLTF